VFRELQQINEQPAVFSQMTIAALWTDPHVSEQMLRYHLDGSVALSSGTTEFIEASVVWMREEFHLSSQSRVLDLGCGPGLYSNRLARAGIDVTGVDFSSRSIAYARETAAREGLRATYVNDDYLAWEPDGRFDLVVMIMRDYCAMAPDQRRTLLGKVRAILAPEGAFLFDVESMAALETQAEAAGYAWSPSGGFWSPNPYFEFLNTCVYREEGVTLDRYEIVEVDRTRTIYNWLAHFDPDRLAAELAAAGLAASSVLGDVTGRPFDPASAQFAVITHRDPGWG
jgi:SAM-dependent methyltransferase